MIMCLKSWGIINNNIENKVAREETSIKGGLEEEA